MWFRNRHLELTLKAPQGLNQEIAKTLNPNNTTKFYDNLVEMYSKHGYQASKIWNVNEFGA